MEILVWGIAFIVAIAVALFVSKKAVKPGAHYDEMQILIRANGYKLAFYITIFINCILVFLYSFKDDIPVIIDEPLGIFIGIMAGITAFAVYCIHKDAFYHVDEKSKVYVFLVAACMILNGVIAVSRIIDGSIWQNGRIRFTQGGSNLILAISFLVMLIAMTAKHLSSNDEVAE